MRSNRIGEESAMSNALAAAADAPDITLGQAAAQTSPAAPPPPLKAPTKIAYGFGSVAFGVATLGLSSAVLQPYMNRVIGLPALWVGTAIMATLIFDAIIDPTIGRFSDNLRTRWGRRHPLMYLSAPLVAIACIAFWNAPASVGATQIGAYLVTMLVLLRLAVSLYEVPSSALAPELTPDYHQRTSLMSYRYFFGMLGGLTMNIVLYQVFLSPKAGGILNREGYAHYGILAAAVMMVSILISSLGTHRRIARLKHPPRPRQSLAESWREIVGTIANPSLVVVMLSGLTSGTATGMNSALSQYFYIELWGISAKQISLLSISGVFASILAVAAVAPISKAMGKKQAMMTLFFVAIFTGALPLTLKLANVLPPNDSPFIFIFLLADTALAYASNSRNQRAVAAGATIDFVAPAYSGDTLTAVGVELHRGGRTALFDVRVTDQNGRQVALLRGKTSTIKGHFIEESQS